MNTRSTTDLASLNTASRIAAPARRQRSFGRTLTIVSFVSAILLGHASGAPGDASQPIAPTTDMIACNPGTAGCGGGGG